MHSKKSSARSAGSGLLRAILGTPLAVTLAWIAYSSLFISRKMPLPPALSGERRTCSSSKAGKLSYYVAGQGRPMLMLHSINAAASSYEVRPLFEYYRQTRRVYALDLPGFGFSERTPRSYTPRLLTDAVAEMLAEIARETGIEQVDAAAISLSSEFLARAASEHPERFRTLTLITPTGFRKGAKQYGKSGSTRAVPFVREFFSFPLWGRPFFDLLNSAPSQRYFLMKTFGSYEAIDEGLLNYDALTAHQPGAQHAPFAFVSGTLFSADIDRVYDTLNMPVWVAYGTRGDFSKVDPKKAAARANWTARSFPTGALPHFEQPEQFCAAYDAFLQGSSA